MAVLDYSRAATGTSPFARLTALISATYGALVQWNEVRQTRKALSALTDRELNDIGLARGDIHTIGA